MSKKNVFRSTPRTAAVQSLDAILTQKRFSNQEIDQQLRQHSWNTEDRRLFVWLVYGTLDHLIWIDHLLEKQSDRPLRKLDNHVLHTLRSSVFQLMEADRIPAYAVLDEAAQTIHHLSPRSVGYVNAVLRSITRKNKKQYLKPPGANSEDKQSLALVFSTPEWLIEEFWQSFTKTETALLLKSFREPPVLTLRVNTLLTEPQDLIRKLQKENVDTEQSTWLPEALHVKELDGLITLTNAYRSGLFQIQGISSMLATHWLDPKPGETVIDLTAGPGGKTTHIAQRMKNHGILLANDLSATKRWQVEQHVKRMGCTIVQIHDQDARKFNGHWTEAADRVLVDAPCSSLGMIRKKPELKYLKTREELKMLPALQLNILRQAAKLVRPGGRLCYTTCTIRKEENQEVIRTFLSEHPHFQPLVMESEFSEGSPGTVGEKEGVIQLGPHLHPDLDGFFIANMKRTMGSNGGGRK